MGSIWSRCPCASCRGGRYAVVRSDSRLCATLLVGQKTVSRLDLSRTVRHPAQRIPLALGRPQILAQLSASVRPGEVLPSLNAGRFGFPGKGRPAPTKPNKTETEFRKILVGTGRGVRRAEATRPHAPKPHGVVINPLLVATIQRLPHITIESTFPSPGRVSPRAAFHVLPGPSKVAIPLTTFRTVQPLMVVGLVSGTGTS